MFDGFAVGGDFEAVEVSVEFGEFIPHGVFPVCRGRGVRRRPAGKEERRQKNGQDGGERQQTVFHRPGKVGDEDGAHGFPAYHSMGMVWPLASKSRVSSFHEVGVWADFASGKAPKGSCGMWSAVGVSGPRKMV